MAVSVELGRRQPGGGVRYLGGRQGLQGRARAWDREGEGRPQGHGGGGWVGDQGQAARTRVLSGEPSRLLPDPFHCCLPAEAAEPAVWRQGVPSGCSGVRGTQKPKSCPPQY